MNQGLKYIFFGLELIGNQMGTFEESERQGLTIVGDMQGHPSIDKYLGEGYEIISF